MNKEEILAELIEHIKYYKELGVESIKGIEELNNLIQTWETSKMAAGSQAMKHTQENRSVEERFSPKSKGGPDRALPPEEDFEPKKEKPGSAAFTTLFGQEKMASGFTPSPSNTPAKDLLFPDSKGGDIFAGLPQNDSLEGIRDSMGDCQRCKLCFGRKTIVFGVGHASAKLMLIGEGPGADEDDQGLPFVGRAGQLLTKILASINLSRGEVYITNVVKCRPPGNRKPEPDEIESCDPFLMRQINVIKPKLICALGSVATQSLLKTKESISRLRGKFMDFHGYPFIATFHPAYLLRNPLDKRLVWEDMQKVRDFLQKTEL